MGRMRNLRKEIKKLSKIDGEELRRRRESKDRVEDIQRDRIWGSCEEEIGMRTERAEKVYREMYEERDRERLKKEKHGTQKGTKEEWK